MTDRNVEPVIDLSKETLLKACQGDVRKLPKFMVHDNSAWPWMTKIRPAKGAIHMRRSTFNNVVAPQIPVKEGLWKGPTVQEFTIDLTAEQLGGSEKQGEATNHEAARALAAADEAGRLPDEADYGAEIVERPKSRPVDPDDLERIAADPERRGVSSGVFSGVGDTERDLAVGNDD